MKTLVKKQKVLIFSAIAISALVAMLIPLAEPFGGLADLAVSLSFAILIGVLTGRFINKMNRAKNVEPPNSQALQPLIIKVVVAALAVWLFFILTNKLAPFQ